MDAYCHGDFTHEFVSNRYMSSWRKALAGHSPRCRCTTGHFLYVIRGALVTFNCTTPRIVRRSTVIAVPFFALVAVSPFMSTEAYLIHTSKYVRAHSHLGIYFPPHGPDNVPEVGCSVTSG